MPTRPIVLGGNGKRTDLPSVDALSFRKAAGCFLTGVTIVTTLDEYGVPKGVTANSFTSVSLDPPLVLVCIGKQSRSFPAFERASGFAVNILASQQREISNTFASSKVVNKFSGLQWHATRAGAAVLDASVAWLDCALYDRLDVGDHVILIGRVVDLHQSATTPLGYYSGGYVSFEAGRQAIDAIGHDEVRVGGVFESNGSLLFLDDGQRISLPLAKSLGEDKKEAGSLLERLDQLGVKTDVNFVYSVYDDPKDRCMYVFYRGEVTCGPSVEATNTVLIPFDQIPWDRLEKNQGLIRRYIRERSRDSFGFYVGTAASGSVHKAKL
jgi:flavin reductase (DIM6/NTAB) family NADH-FMN oxidoreductase RutF